VSGGPASIRRRRLTVDLGPLRHRGFRMLFVGQTVSNLGGMLGTVAVPFQMYPSKRVSR
jgi:hypothetical protein